MSAPAIAEVWTFQSESNCNREYQTTRYVDGSTSCQCKGWTMRRSADGKRSCRHTIAVDSGRAASQCIGHVSYSEARTTRPQRQEQTTSNRRAIDLSDE